MAAGCGNGGETGRDTHPAAAAEAAEGAVTTTRNGADRASGPSRYLYVWAADADRRDSDFLAVIGADPDSADYGRVIATVPAGFAGGAHHTEHRMPEGDRLFANSFAAGSTAVFDLGDPRRPALAAVFQTAGPYALPHSFERLPGGNVLATFQTRTEGGAGGLVELDSLGGFVRAGSAANEVEPHVRPYSLLVLPDRDRVVSTTTDMRSRVPAATTIQVWRLSDLALLHTVRLPESPGSAHLLPAEPRRLPTGEVIVSTFACGLFLLEGLESEQPRARLVARLEWQNPRECAVPVIRGRFWVHPNATTYSLVTFDMSNPESPRQVAERQLEPGEEPHWLAIEPDGDRIVVTGVGTLRGRVLLARLDPETGEVELVGEFGAAGAGTAGVDFGRTSWPHGDTGAAVPHGTVFSRP